MYIYIYIHTYIYIYITSCQSPASSNVIQHVRSHAQGLTGTPSRRISDQRFSMPGQLSGAPGALALCTLCKDNTWAHAIAIGYRTVLKMAGLKLVAFWDQAKTVRKGTEHVGILDKEL